MNKPRPKSNSMTKHAKLLALMLTTSLLSTNALSAPIEEQLAKCDAALGAKIQEASLCGLGVQLRTNELERLQKQNADLLSSGAAWYNNGFVWAAIGVIAGTYIGARATR